MLSLLFASMYAAGLTKYSMIYFILFIFGGILQCVLYDKGFADVLDITFIMVRRCYYLVTVIF